jgi:RNA polymerase sigma-70 factor (ECF subfamily)
MRDADQQSDSAAGSTISTSLLEGIKDLQHDAWMRLTDLYGPVVYWYCRHAGLAPEDAADLAQEVFAAVAAHISEFRRDRPGDSFRSWLWTIMRNKIRDYFRRESGRAKAAGGTAAHQRIMRLPEPTEAEVEQSSSEGSSLLSHRAVKLVRVGFEDQTWQAFWRTAVEGQTPAGVAEDLGMTLHAVYKAKSRVLCRLRQECGDLIQ